MNQTALRIGHGVIGIERNSPIAIRHSPRPISSISPNQRAVEMGEDRRRVQLDGAVVIGQRLIQVAFVMPYGARSP